jgi:hypothetical protein
MEKKVGVSTVLKLDFEELIESMAPHMSYRSFI